MKNCSKLIISLCIALFGVNIQAQNVEIKFKADIDFTERPDGELPNDGALKSCTEFHHFLYAGDPLAVQFIYDRSELDDSIPFTYQGNVSAYLIDFDETDGENVLATVTSSGNIQHLEALSKGLIDWPISIGLLEFVCEDLSKQSYKTIAGITKIESVVIEETIERRDVHINIRPRRCPNKIRVPAKNPNRKLTIALLGQADFNVDNVNLNSLELEGVKPVKNKTKDITSPHYPVDPLDPSDCGEIIKDGYNDIRLQFSRDEIASAIEIKLGRPVENGEVVKLELLGEMNDGAYFKGEDYLTLKVRK